METRKLLKFEANWCAPCRFMSPVVKSVLEGYENIELVVVDIDNEQGQEEARKFNVRNIPTLILLDDENNIINTLVGTASESQVKEFLNN